MQKKVFNLTKIQLERCSSTYRTWLMTVTAFHDICLVGFRMTLSKLKAHNIHILFL